MDELEQVLTAAHPTVNWFALGEAKRLADAIRVSVRDYKTDKKCPDKRKKMVETAKSVASFLALRATEAALKDSHAIREQLDAVKETSNEPRNA